MTTKREENNFPYHIRKHEQYSRSQLMFGSNDPLAVVGLTDNQLCGSIQDDNSWEAAMRQMGAL